MQLEETCAVEITELVEYVDSKDGPLKQTARMHQHVKSAVLQTARCLTTEVHRGTKQIKDSTAQKTNERWRRKRTH